MSWQYNPGGASPKKTFTTAFVVLVFAAVCLVCWLAFGGL